jgi:hypothetical protein
VRASKSEVHVASPAWVKYVAIGCGVLLVGGIVFGTALFFGVRKLTAEPERVAREFLDAAAAGDFARAHDCFSAPLKEAQPLEEFVAAAEANPSLFDVEDTTFTSRSIDAASGAKLEGTVTLRSGTRLPASFHLVQERDRWKLLSYHLGTTD